MKLPLALLTLLAAPHADANANVPDLQKIVSMRPESHGSVDTVSTDSVDKKKPKPRPEPAPDPGPKPRPKPAPDPCPACGMG